MSSPVTDVAALYRTLDAAALAAFTAEVGDATTTALALLRASAASAFAFPAGSCEADALGVILGAIQHAAIARGTPTHDKTTAGRDVRASRPASEPTPA